MGEYNQGLPYQSYFHDATKIQAQAANAVSQTNTRIHLAGALPTVWVFAFDPVPREEGHHPFQPQANTHTLKNLSFRDFSAMRRGGLPVVMSVPGRGGCLFAADKQIRKYHRCTDQSKFETYTCTLNCQIARTSWCQNESQGRSLQVSTPQRALPGREPGCVPRRGCGGEGLYHLPIRTNPGYNRRANRG